MTQEDILISVLNKYREVERLQEDINLAVQDNRKRVKENPEFEDGYTDSIESYYMLS